jgi:AraC family ethanolamine operon transcriptional activator
MIVIRVAAERFRQDLRTLRRADVPKEPTVLRLTDRQLARIESTVADALVEHPARGIEQCELEGNLVSAVVAALAADARVPDAEGTGLSVYRTAREFLRESMGEPVSLADLCRIADASESTLRRAFRRQAGVSPTAFLRAQRLAHARRLLKGRLVRSVSDAALQSGFTELGRFAGHYRTMFGELPSKTFAEHV